MELSELSVGCQLSDRHCSRSSQPLPFRSNCRDKTCASCLCLANCARPSIIALRCNAVGRLVILYDDWARGAGVGGSRMWVPSESIRPTEPSACSAPGAKSIKRSASSSSSSARPTPARKAATSTTSASTSASSGRPSTRASTSTAASSAGAAMTTSLAATSEEMGDADWDEDSDLDDLLDD